MKTGMIVAAALLVLAMASPALARQPKSVIKSGSYSLSNGFRYSYQYTGSRWQHFIARHPVLAKLFGQRSIKQIAEKQFRERNLISSGGSGGSMGRAAATLR